MIIQKVFRQIDSALRSVAAFIIVALMLPFDDGRVKMPTAQAAMWMITLALLPITLLLSTPFWLLSFGAAKIASLGEAS